MIPSFNTYTDAAPALSASLRMAMKRMHLALLHGTAGGGQVVLSREAPELDAGWEDALVWQMRAADSRALVDAMYVGMNLFRFRRGADTVHVVGHLWMDFDYRTSDAAGASLAYAHLDEEAVIYMLLAAFEAGGIPFPSFFTASGQGLHAVWICDRLQASAQRKVSKVMAALYGPVLRPDGTCPVRRRRDPVRDNHEARMLPLWQLARDLGLDRGARDPARVLRLWGSVNGKNGALCRMAWPSQIEDVAHHEFNTLSDAVMPLTRWQLKAILAERAAWRRANPQAAAVHAMGQRRIPAGRWARIAQDLVRLCGIRGGMPKGSRHLWVFLTANARAHAYGGDEVQWASELGAMVGLTEAEALDCLATLDRRAQRHAAGETDDYGGKAVSPLYNYAPATMVDLLSITETEGEALLVLVPGGAVERTPAQRQADKRIRDGSKPRAEQVAARLADGRRAITMRAEGRTMAEVCQALGRGESSVRQAMREAAENVVETVVATPETSADSDTMIPRDPSRYIGPLATHAPARPPPSPSELADPVASPALYDRPRIIRNSASSWEYRTGPDTGTIVYRNADGLHGWSAFSISGGDADLPPGFLDERKAEKARRRLRAASQPLVDRARRFRALTAITRPTAPSAISLTPAEYKLISQGW